jgi:hypothetical protein
MNLVVGNEYLNYDGAKVGFASTYNDAKIMIDNKLNHQIKNSHIMLMKKYTYNKIKIINYYSNLGKLKAFYKIQ